VVDAPASPPDRPGADRPGADLVVVGSVALDNVQTPFGKVTEALGGSATYFAYAASFFTRVRVVGAVGADFPAEHLRLLAERGVDIGALEVLPDQKTFRWTGEYGFDLNEAKTLDVQLNAFAEFRPVLPAGLRRAPFLFLANIDPELQADVLGQMDRPRFTALDTMNFWIDGKRDALLRVLARVDALLINDAEARMLAREPNLIKAARAIVAMGPRLTVIKRGEYGALMVLDGRFFFVPAYPLDAVFDPTGAGDTFAGGFMGYLAREGTVDPAGIRRAIVHGAVMASFTVEDFSLERLRRLDPEDIARRYEAFQQMVRVED
jgi:sugar/nucleoside kinase (ribokinase family)